MQKFKNKSKGVLRFSLGAEDFVVRAGGTVTAPADSPYIAGLVATGVLEEKPAPVQIEDNLSSDAGTASPKTEAPAETPTAKTVTKAAPKAANS